MAWFAPGKNIFHQNNFHTSKSALKTAKISEIHFGLFEHPLCLPDLTPTDFRLKPHQKDLCEENIFDRRNESWLSYKDLVCTRKIVC